MLNLKAILNISIKGLLAVRHVIIAAFTSRPVNIPLVLDTVCKIPKLFLGICTIQIIISSLIDYKISWNTPVNISRMASSSEAI